jgi:hypothetical protein
MPSVAPPKDHFDETIPKPDSHEPCNAFGDLPYCVGRGIYMLSNSYVRHEKEGPSTRALQDIRKDCLLQLRGQVSQEEPDIDTYAIRVNDANRALGPEHTMHLVGDNLIADGGRFDFGDVQYYEVEKKSPSNCVLVWYMWDHSMKYLLEGADAEDALRRWYNKKDDSYAQRILCAVKTTRIIFQGEELLLDYGHEHWQRANKTAVCRDAMKQSEILNAVLNDMSNTSTYVPMFLCDADHSKRHCNTCGYMCTSNHARESCVLCRYKLPENMKRRIRRKRRRPSVKKTKLPTTTQKIARSSKSIKLIESKEQVPVVSNKRCVDTTDKDRPRKSLLELAKTVDMATHIKRIEKEEVDSEYIHLFQLTKQRNFDISRETGEITVHGTLDKNKNGSNHFEDLLVLAHIINHFQLEPFSCNQFKVTPSNKLANLEMLSHPWGPNKQIPAVYEECDDDTHFRLRKLFLDAVLARANRVLCAS